MNSGSVDSLKAWGRCGARAWAVVRRRTSLTAQHAGHRGPTPAESSAQEDSYRTNDQPKTPVHRSEAESDIVFQESPSGWCAWTGRAGPGVRRRSRRGRRAARPTSPSASPSEDGKGNVTVGFLALAGAAVLVVGVKRLLLRGCAWTGASAGAHVPDPAPVG